jgi:hypothetical protein
MKKLLTRLITGLLVISIGAVTFGCDKKKALATVRDADELAAKLLIYGRNIARANNDSFRAGNIPADVHLATNKAAEKYLQGLDIFLDAIATAKKVVAEGGTPKIDVLEAVFNQHVIAFATELINRVVTIPDAQGWSAALSLAISSFRALFAGVRMEVNDAAV